MSSPEPQVVRRVHHDWRTDVPLSTTVVSAVADVTGTEPEELPPLYDSIDPEALDNLFAPRPSASLTEGSVTFEFAGYPITVRSTGAVLVYES